MATPSNFQEQTTCIICKDTFKSPIQLPCKHTFCIECVSTKASDEEDGKVTCPRCKETCNKNDCVEDKDAKQLIELYDTCTDGKKHKQGSTKVKFHLPKRKISKKHNITFEEMKSQKAEGHSEESTLDKNAIEQSKGEKTILTKASPLRPTTSTSSSSSNDSEQEPCPICFKHSAKWVCMKCFFKSCNPCCQNYPLLCKDQTSNHTFVESDSICVNNDVMDKLHIVPSTAVPKLPESKREQNIPATLPKQASTKTALISDFVKKVTFQDLDEDNESTTDEFKPRFRDSIALTKDKKQSLENIIDEVHKIEKSGKETEDSLICYHQYMTDVKAAGYNLIDQTEHVMIEKVQHFFANLRKDYESGFNEVTGVTEQLQENVTNKMQEMQNDALILEEIVENNDTRVLQDEAFLNEKCGHLDGQITELGKTIVQCKRAGLPDAKEWDEKKKVDFEKQMNVHILTATEAEMKEKLMPTMTDTVNKLKPVVSTEYTENVKRKKLLECVLC